MTNNDTRLELDIERWFPRIDSRALGLAVGLTASIATFIATVIQMAVEPDGLPIGLLRQYFAGYDITWPGAVAGMAWGCLVGFIAGTLLGLVHNATLDVWLLFVHARTDLSQRRHLTDHIR